MLNDYLKFIYMLLGAMAIVYAIFHLKDVLSWFWGKGKNVVVGIYNRIKGLIKK